MNHFYVQSRPEEKVKILEKKVNDLIEESCMAYANGDLQLVSKMLKYSDNVITFVLCMYIHI